MSKNVLKVENATMQFGGVVEGQRRCGDLVGNEKGRLAQGRCQLPHPGGYQ